MEKNLHNLKKRTEATLLSEIESNRFLVLFLRKLVSELKDEHPLVRLFISGGVIRDIATSLAFKITLGSKDLDFVVEGISDSPLQFLLERLSKSCEEVEWFDRVGMSFPVWKVKVKGIPEPLDIALTRTERSFGSGYSDFHISSMGVSVEEESLRRDFTINALYLELIIDNRRHLNVQLHDFHGGLPSILNREIRCVGEAEDRFSEDPLRMLRAIRFEAKLGFYIEEKTSQAIQRLISRLLGTVARERIADELYRILILNPKLALDEFYNYGVFQEILPEVVVLPKAASHRMEKQLNFLVERYGHRLNPALIFAALLLELAFAELEAKVRGQLWTAKMDEYFFNVPKVSELAKLNKLPNVKMIERLCHGALILIHYRILKQNDAVIEGLLSDRTCRDEIIALYSAIQESYGKPAVDFLSIVEKLPRCSTDFGQLIRTSGLPVGSHLRNIKMALRQAEINGEISDEHSARALLDWLYASDTHLIRDHVDKICNIIKYISQPSSEETSQISESLASEIRWLLFTRPLRLLQVYRSRKVLEYVFPELAELDCMEHESIHHFSKSSLNDAMIGLSLLYEEIESPTPLQILSVIFLDIGKPKTRELKPDGSTTFHNHDIEGADMALSICRRLGIGQALASDLYFIVRNHNTLLSHGGPNRVKRLTQKVEQGLIDDLLLVHKIDQMAKMKIIAGQRIDEGQLDNYNNIMARLDVWRAETEENLKWRSMEQGLFLTGTDLRAYNPSWGTGLPEGPEVGRIIKLLTDMQAKGIVRNKDEAVKSASGRIILHHLLNDPVRYLADLRKMHLLKILLPELDALINFSQNSIHHTEDCFSHTLNVVSGLPEQSSKELVLAALFHDSGKASTRTWDETKSVFHFYGHEKESTEIFGKVCERLGWTSDDFDVEATLWLIRYHDRIKQTWSKVKRPKRTLRRIFFDGGQSFDVGEKRWVELIDLSEADIIGSVPADSMTTDTKMAELAQLRLRVKEFIEELKHEEEKHALDEKVQSIWNGHSVLRYFSVKGAEVGRLVRLGQDYARTKLRHGDDVTEDQVMDYLNNLNQQ